MLPFSRRNKPKPEPTKTFPEKARARIWKNLHDALVGGFLGVDFERLMHEIYDLCVRKEGRIWDSSEIRESRFHKKIMFFHFM